MHLMNQEQQPQGASDKNKVFAYLYWSLRMIQNET